MMKSIAKRARVREIVREYIKKPISVTIKALKKERLGRSESYIYGIRSRIKAEGAGRKAKSSRKSRKVHPRPGSTHETLRIIIEVLITRRTLLDSSISDLERAAEVVKLYEAE